MDNEIQIIKWGSDYLLSQGYLIKRPPEIVQSTPWSTVIRFSISTNDVYLKQTPPSLFLSLEPKIISILSEKFPAQVPVVMAINDNLHCFLMQDAGQPLRKILKGEFRVELLCQAIQQYASIQRSTEDKIQSFLELGVLDYRLDKLPILYDELINKTDFLKEEGLSDRGQEILHGLSPQFSEKCRLLSSYGVPETLGQHDFHDNNVLIDPKTKKITSIDLGESIIVHPFFPLYTCLRQATIHHEIKETDEHYQILQDACLDNWLGLMPKQKLLEQFILIKELWPIFSVLACYDHMMSVDLKAYKSHYANRPNKIVEYFREYIQIGLMR